MHAIESMNLRIIRLRKSAKSRDEPRKCCRLFTPRWNARGRLSAPKVNSNNSPIERDRKVAYGLVGTGKKIKSWQKNITQISVGLVPKSAAKVCQGVKASGAKHPKAGTIRSR